MISNGFDESLLTQKFALGEVQYYLRQGSILDKSQHLTVLDSIAITNTKSWVRWNDQNIGDMEFTLPGFAVGHKVLMLGAKITRESKLVYKNDRLAVWNMDSHKGYLMYKSAPDKDYDASNAAYHELVKMSNFCATTKDMAIHKFFKLALPLGAVVAGIIGWFLLKHVVGGVMGVVFSVVVMLIWFYWWATGARKLIMERVWEISRSLKYEIKTEA